jgi:hypothetical protein
MRSCSLTEPYLIWTKQVSSADIIMPDGLVVFDHCFLNCIKSLSDYKDSLFESSVNVPAQNVFSLYYCSIY